VRHKLVTVNRKFLQNFL